MLRLPLQPLPPPFSSLLITTLQSLLPCPPPAQLSALKLSPASMLFPFLSPFPPSPRSVSSPLLLTSPSLLLPPLLLLSTHLSSLPPLPLSLPPSPSSLLLSSSMCRVPGYIHYCRRHTHIFPLLLLCFLFPPRLLRLCLFVFLAVSTSLQHIATHDNRQAAHPGSDFRNTLVHTATICATLPHSVIHINSLQRAFFSLSDVWRAYTCIHHGYLHHIYICS